MGMFSCFSGLFDDNGSALGSDPFWDDNAINPANGLPMVDGIGGVDIEGNPFGTDFSHDDSFSGINDSFGSGSGFDDW